jgi:hypothetical protein
MPSTIPTKIRRLIATAQNVLTRRATLSDAAAHEARRVLKLLDPLPPLSGSFQKSDHPITAFIGNAIKTSDETSALLDAATPVLRYLPWKYNYEPRPDLPDLGLRMGWAELIGPEAPYRSAAVCLGLTLIAPESHYPAHHHPAIELYHVITGTAAWVLDGVPRLNPPGSFILHPSQSVHAMRTGPEALLALYTWSGPDVTTLSDYSI